VYNRHPNENPAYTTESLKYYCPAILFYALVYDDDDAGLSSGAANEFKSGRHM